MIIYQHRIYRKDLQNNPDVLYVFGDNTLRMGMGGQAGEMRGEPNAVGVATKRRPGMNPSDFFTDDDLVHNVAQIVLDIQRIVEHLKNGGIVVVPADGIGTGLSELPTRAPKTYSFLCTYGLGGAK